MMKFSFLNNRFSLLDKKADRYLLIVVVFVFSVVFLNIFQPFNIARWYSDSGFIQFLRLSSYGFVIGIVFLFTQFPLRKIFKVENFKIKSYLLWLAIEIALINLVYTPTPPLTRSDWGSSAPVLAIFALSTAILCLHNFFSIPALQLQVTINLSWLATILTK